MHLSSFVVRVKAVIAVEKGLVERLRGSHFLSGLLVIFPPDTHPSISPLILAFFMSTVVWSYLGLSLSTFLVVITGSETVTFSSLS